MMKFQEKKKLITLLEYIQHWEGFRSKPYRCPAGKLTIGYGRNIEDRLLSANEYRMLYPGFTVSAAMKLLLTGIDERQATRLLKYDIDNIIFQLKNENWTKNLSRNRKMVIFDMCYNLGYNGLLGFKKMINAIRECDYEEASMEIHRSRYFDQVGQRANCNACIMFTGLIPADIDDLSI